MEIFPQALTDKILSSSTFNSDNNAVVVKLGDGKTQRCGVGKDPFHEIWSCNWNIRSSDYNTLISFYNRHGLVKAFQWTTPLMDTATFVFDGAPVVQYDGVMTYNVSMNLKEVKESLL